VLRVPVQYESQSETEVCFVYRCNIRGSQKQKCASCTGAIYEAVRNRSVLRVPVQYESQSGALKVVSKH